jgi:glucose-6-phosphate 1-dehydrogenase
MEINLTTDTFHANKKRIDNEKWGKISFRMRKTEMLFKH